MTGQLREYEVRCYDWPPSYHTATSRGKAKVQAYYDADGDIPYTAFRARVAGPPRSSEAFLHCAEYRGVAFARVGMKVIVDGRTGYIVGHNSSANFNVLFEDGRILNCHPNWKMEFPDRSEGTVL